jgi:hypothetical protein
MKNMIYKESISHFLDSGLSPSNHKRKLVLDDGGSNINDDSAVSGGGNCIERRIDVTSIRLLIPTGSPQLTLSDGRTFYYSLDMRVWVNMPQNTATSTAALLDSLVSGSFSTTNSSAGSSSSSSLTNRALAAKAVSELEDAVCAFKVTRRHIELRKAVKLYALKLTACETPDCVGKIEELCEELVSSSSTTAASIATTNISDVGSVLSSSLDDEFGLLPRRELLKELLPIFSTNRNLQRLVSTYEAALAQTTRVLL